MLRQQSENKPTKDAIYSSIFSGSHTAAAGDGTRRSSTGIGSESPSHQSNTAPLVIRRPRPDWAEPTVSIDQATPLLKSSVERKGEERNVTTEKSVSYNVSTRLENNSIDSNPYPSPIKSSNNNYSDHFQKVSTITGKSTSVTPSSLVEHNINAKMSFLNHTPVNGTMTGNGEASRLPRHTVSTVNNSESISKTSTKTTSLGTSTTAAASEASNNISTNSAISPNNNIGVVNENSSSGSTKRNISTTSGDSMAEPCV